MIVNYNNLGATTSSAIVASTGNIAAGLVPGLIATGIAVPIIGAAIAGVTLAVSMFLNRNAEYFAQAKATTHIVDEAETLMKNNLAAWNQSPTKYQSEQKQALDNFNQIWNQVVQACMNPGYGSPGHACVADRSRGGRWDWFSYYYDPIANDSQTQPDPILSSGGVENTISNIGDSVNSFVDNLSNGETGLGGLLIPALLLVGGYLIVRKIT